MQLFFPTPLLLFEVTLKTQEETGSGSCTFLCHHQPSTSQKLKQNIKTSSIGSESPWLGGRAREHAAAFPTGWAGHTCLREAAAGVLCLSAPISPPAPFFSLISFLWHLAVLSSLPYQSRRRKEERKTPRGWVRERRKVKIQNISVRQQGGLDSFSRSSPAPQSGVHLFCASSLRLTSLFSFVTFSPSSVTSEKVIHRPHNKSQHAWTHPGLAIVLERTVNE